MLNLLLFAAIEAAAGDTLVVPMDEIVVHGTRTKESLLKAPAAISVVDRSSFAAKRGIGLADAVNYIPGLFVQSRAGAQDVRITIRGFGARGSGERSNVGSMRGIRVVTDGIDVTEPDGRTSLDLVDLGTADEVEIGRSNSSAQYGNAAGGVVELRTRLDFEQPWANAQARAGSFGYHREEARAGFSMGQGRGTLSLANTTFPGWRVHSSTWATIGQFRFTTPLDQVSKLGVLVDGVSDLQHFPGALTQAEYDADPKQADPDFVTRDERRRNRVARLALKFDRTPRPTSDLSLTGYVEPKVFQRSERNRFRDFNRYHLGASGTYQHRGRLNDQIQGRVGVGLDEGFQDGSILFYRLDNGNRSDTLATNKREAANRFGGFMEGELTWSHWSVRGSARYDAIRYLAEDRIDPEINASKTFVHWTPKGSVAWLADKHTVYAALGGGVETPAFNEVDPPDSLAGATALNPFLEATHSTTFELGAKGSLGPPGAGLRYDTALYWIKVKNDLVPQEGGAYFETAGETERRGVELGLDWATPVTGLALRGVTTLSRNEYVTYVNDQGDFSDNDMAGLPEVTASLKARYTIPQGLGFEATVEHVGDYFVDDANQASVPDYTILGATIDANRKFGQMLVSLFVTGTNIADSKYIASAFINGVNGEYFEPGLPQNWSTGISVRWQ